VERFDAASLDKTLDACMTPVVNLNILFAIVYVAAAAIVAAALIILMRPLLLRYALAIPNRRSSHSTPTPQGGGIAVIASTIVVSGIVAVWLGVATPLLYTLLAAAAALAVLGAIDDIRPLGAALRLGLQALAVLVVMIAMPVDWQALPTLPLVVERALLLVAGLWFINLVNFMDGLDWMTVAEVVPVAGALAALGLSGLYPIPTMLVALALFGAMLGFAPFNRPVARLFLGDVGSLPIGLVLGTLLYALAVQGYFAAALILPMYYLFDATITLLRRLARGERIWEAHRQHFYQRAVDGGMTATQIASHVFLLNLVLTALAILTILYPAFSIASVVSAMLIVGAALWRFGTARRQSSVH
jgi:UDP-N-acetylmuramyl pentapeptide phosphotransferase/UDP-N-acetylglucosamine-1-phosphate transferase